MTGPHPDVVPTEYKCGCELVRHPDFTSNAIWESVYARCPEHDEPIRFPVEGSKRGDNGE